VLEFIRYLYIADIFPFVLNRELKCVKGNDEGVNVGARKSSDLVDDWSVDWWNLWLKQNGIKNTTPQRACYWIFSSILPPTIASSRGLYCLHIIDSATCHRFFPPTIDSTPTNQSLSMLLQEFRSQSNPTFFSFYNNIHDSSIKPKKVFNKKAPKTFCLSLHLRNCRGRKI
jgi:hypothetical protein